MRIPTSARTGSLPPSADPDRPLIASSGGAARAPGTLLSSQLPHYSVNPFEPWRQRSMLRALPEVVCRCSTGAPDNFRPDALPNREICKPRCPQRGDVHMHGQLRDKPPLCPPDSLRSAAFHDRDQVGVESVPSSCLHLTSLRSHAANVSNSSEPTDSPTSTFAKGTDRWRKTHAAPRNEMPVDLCGKRGQPLCTAGVLWRDIPSWGTPYPPRRCWGPVATTAPSRKRSKRLCQSGSRLGENAPWVGHRPGRIIFNRTFLPPLLLLHFLHAGHVTVPGTGGLTQRARGIQLWKTHN
jgi:hypothetical protein